MKKEFENPFNLTKEQMTRNITEPFGDLNKIPVGGKYDPESELSKKITKLGKEIGLSDKSKN